MKLIGQAYCAGLARGFDDLGLDSSFASEGKNTQRQPQVLRLHLSRWGCERPPLNHISELVYQFLKRSILKLFELLYPGTVLAPADGEVPAQLSVDCFFEDLRVLQQLGENLFALAA